MSDFKTMLKNKDSDLKPKVVTTEPAAEPAAKKINKINNVDKVKNATKIKNNAKSSKPTSKELVDFETTQLRVSVKNNDILGIIKKMEGFKSMNDLITYFIKNHKTDNKFINGFIESEMEK